MITHADVYSKLHIVHKRHIKPDIVAYIGLEKTHMNEYGKYLALWVFDDSNGHIMTLKMSTFRSLVRFMDDWDLRRPRHLNFLEKLFTRKAK